VVYNYDENGNKIERLKYNSDNVLSEKNVSKFDNKGNEIEENVYQSDGTLFHKKKYKYDKNDNMIEFISLTPTIKVVPTQIDYWEFEYDKNKNWIKRISFRNGTIQSRVERIIEYY